MKRRVFIKDVLMGVGLLTSSRISHAAISKRPQPPKNLDFISTKMTLLKRAEWTKLVPKPWLLRSSGEYDRLTVHHAAKSVNYHTAKADVMRDIEGIYSAHLKREYGDIAYHFVIDYSGRVWEARSLSYEGAHVAKNNENNIGIVLLGNFEEQDPSKEQLASMKKLTSILREQYRIKKHRVYGHSDLGKTACPGKSLYPHVQKLKSNTKKEKKGKK